MKNSVQNLPSTASLGGNERPLLFLTTDKPLYKPGETVYMRAVALQASGFFPLREVREPVRLNITSPRKQELVSLYAQVSDSSAGFFWVIPPGTPGGRYTASAELYGSPSAERGFEIRAYAPPRLKTQVVFLREGYGPGDTVNAALSVVRAEGGIPAGAGVTAVARVDGQEAARISDLSVNAEGMCQVSFPLPKNMDQGEGTLAFIIEDGGIQETASKTIPILLQTLDIAFYPEGGDLIAGLPGRIYVQARRPDGKPADIEGVIEGTGLELRTLHEGRGVVEFKPQAGTDYRLRLTNPSGITKTFPLPEVKTQGASIRADKPAYAFDQPVTLTVYAAPESGAAKVTLFHREIQVAEAPVTPGESKVSLTPGEAEGVLMATVWDKAGTPLAERLIFRQPRYALRIGVTVEAPASVPGAPVTLILETRDENNRPVEAVVGLAVTDDALLEMVERRDQAPNLPVMVYLENEVKDLADAQVYLDPENPDAARNVDLILGVQGWRRFVLMRLDEALDRDPEAVRRALAIRIPPPPPMPAPMMMRRDEMQAKMRVELQDNDLEKVVEDILLEEVVEDIEIVEEGAEPFLPADIPAAREVEIRANLKMLEPRADLPFITIREYAHSARPNRRPNERADFTETIYWHAGVRTNPRDGAARVSFDLPDSVTTFRVRADAFGNNGALGAARAEIASKEPFYMEPKLPPVLLAGDTPEIPLILVNSTPERIPFSGLQIHTNLPALKNIVPARKPNVLDPGSRRVLFGFTVPAGASKLDLTLNAAAGAYTDSVTRSLDVLPRGFPLRETASGLLGPDKPFARTFILADDLEEGSQRAEVKVYPTPLANMEEALNALLRQPHGCFEQTSSTSFPLVMAQQYFLSHTGIAPDKIKKAEELLKESYKRLTSFESPAKGYEWFGEDPGHEALTAYGVMQFTEMGRVMPVDQGMITRTRSWLLSRRDGAGGFKRNEKALDSFGSAPVPLTNLYILWTLLESGEKAETLQTEILAAKELVKNVRDPYLLALGMNILYLAGDASAAKRAAEALLRAQSRDGSLPGAETSITRSSGEALHIETNSLAVIGWLRCGGDYAGAVESAMGWLFERCKAGRFGNTQSTILALKAINAYDAARSRPKAPGTIQLRVNGRDLGRPLAFTPESQGALILPDFSAALSPGKHQLELVMKGGGDMPFALEISYHTPRPASSPECPLILSTALSAGEAREGEPLDLRLTLTAKEKDVSMPIAIIGLPAGLEPRHERLGELITAGKIAAYEMRGRELALYWRGLQGGAKLELSLPLTAAAPGIYTAPASRAYAFYQDDHQYWVAGEHVKITPR